MKKTLKSENATTNASLCSEGSRVVQNQIIAIASVAPQSSSETRTNSRENC